MFPGVSPRFWVFAAFLALVFLMGGGSRDDVASLVLLRPACAFFAAYALTVAEPGQIAPVRVPLLLLLALGVWMIAQLIPLPPSMWSGLPGRAMVADLDKLVGLEGVWRPISLSPSKTMNALASLVVPISGLLLYAVLPVDDRRRIFGLLLAVAAISALFGIGQVGTGGTGPLYLYSQTNEHDPVGLFANRNHDAVFLATMFLLASYLLSEHRRLAFRGDRSVKPVLIAGVCVLVAGILLFSNSRAGLLIGLLSLGMALALYLAGRPRPERDDLVKHGIVRRYLPIAAVLIVTVVALFLFARSTSIDRLVTQSAADDIRAKVFSQVAAMANDNWLFGTGFGSFEHIYRTYESSTWLNQNYLNNAHNDWLQWVIEGGLPAILVVLTFWAWVARKCWGYWRGREGNPALVRLVATALGVLLLLLVASALDYPLRVPSMMLYAILMVAFVADPPEPMVKVTRRSGRSRGDSHRRPMLGETERWGAVQ